MSDLTFIKDTVYGLKREYGEPIVVGSRTEVPDRVTGEKNLTLATFNIAKAIPLPINLRHAFLVSIGQQRKEGRFDNNKRDFLIDKSDIPTGKVIDDNSTYIQYKGQNEDVIGVEDFEYAMIVSTKKVK